MASTNPFLTLVSTIQTNSIGSTIATGYIPYVSTAGRQAYTSTLTTLAISTLTTSTLNTVSTITSNVNCSTLFGSTMNTTNVNTSAMTVNGALSATSITGPLGSAASAGVVQIGTGLTVSGGLVYLPYFVWHFNWNVANAFLIGSSGLMNSINNTNISGTFINNPSYGQLTTPVAGMYMCIMDATGGAPVDNWNRIYLRVNSSRYNPYDSAITTYKDFTINETLYLTAGQVIDFYCDRGGVVASNVSGAGSGGGRGITFALLR